MLYIIGTVVFALTLRYDRKFANPPARIARRFPSFRFTFRLKPAGRLSLRGELPPLLFEASGFVL